MMRRFEILKDMHFGPMQRNVKVGDILCWDTVTRRASLNGTILEENKSMDFEGAVSMLDRQIAKDPDHPWSRELSSVNVSMSKMDDVQTDTQVVLPILGCLKAAEEFLKTKEDWKPTNEDQYQFIKMFGGSKELVDQLGDNLKRKADFDVNVINTWLKENRFDIQLEPDGSPDAFAVASILSVLVEWAKKGDEDKIRGFPAVKIKNVENDKPVVTCFLDPEVHPYPIVRVETKTDDAVFMSVMDYLKRDETFALMDKIEKLRTVIDKKNRKNVDGVIFPMVDYNRQVDISWIKGMKIADFFIGQALQQTKFRMNEVGAKAESAVCMMLKRCLSPLAAEIIRIDKPFVLWIERKGVAIPLFTGVFAEDVWKKPANLD